MKINSRTRIIGLLGHPVTQSFSPNIHNYLFDKYRINNIYCCFDIEEDIEKSIDAIKVMGLQGCNVTIPHKVNVVKYLDNIEENTKLIGAVNTIKNEGGKLKGYNTDGIGFVKSILDKNYLVKNKKVMIIGAGGSCRSIAIELASNNAKSIEIRNRSIEKARDIVSILKKKFDISSSCSTQKINKNDLDNIDILINTTPIGMESDLCPIDENIVISKELLVCDIVYKPNDTQLIKWAYKNNLNVVYGIDMLINQALHAFYIWTGIKPTEEDKESIRSIYKDYIKK